MKGKYQKGDMGLLKTRVRDSTHIPLRRSSVLKHFFECLSDRFLILIGRLIFRQSYNRGMRAVSKEQSYLQY
jgi:hypothetical protein